MSTRTVRVRLTTEDHVFHPLEFDYKGDPPKDTGDGGALITYDTDFPLTVMCLVDNVRLIEGEDYILEEVEPWQSV
jgi:hypothetical protein